jgi:hypothetical protein
MEGIKMALETSRELPSGKDIDRLIADSMDNPETFPELLRQYGNGTLPPFIGSGSELYELIKLAAEEADRWKADLMNNPEAFLKLVKKYKDGTLPSFISPDSEGYELIKLMAQQEE